MQVKFSNVDGEFPYKSEYVGFQTPPIAVNLGIGGVRGHSVKTYIELVSLTLKDLAIYAGPVQVIFEDNITLNEEAKGLTKLLFNEFQRTNYLEDKLYKIEQLSKSRFDVKYDQP